MGDETLLNARAPALNFIPKVLFKFRCRKLNRWTEERHRLHCSSISSMTSRDFAKYCIGQEHVAQRKDLRHESQAPAFRSGERCRARRATPAARLTPDPDG